MNRKVIYRTKGNLWCAIELEIRKDGELSICGMEGELFSRPPRGAEVDKREGGKAYVLYSCGQIRDALAEFFPEARPYFKWHLNHMHAECEHQETRGETWTTHPMAQCPDCGYKLGTAWLKRELPPEVVAWAEAFTE